MSAFIILWKSKPRVGHTTAEDYVAPAPQPPDHDREVLSDSANARDSCLVPSTGASESYGETPTSGGNEQKEPPASQQVDSVMVTVTQLLAAQRRMMEAQVQATVAQTVAPLRKFSGESINTNKGSIDRWVEHFEE